jgi:hypothetical protein
MRFITLCASTLRGFTAELKTKHFKNSSKKFVVAINTLGVVQRIYGARKFSACQENMHRRGERARWHAGGVRERRHLTVFRHTRFLNMGGKFLCRQDGNVSGCVCPFVLHKE